MGEPNKGRDDPEKGLGLVDEPETMSEGITSVFSKAGEGITNVLSRAGEGIHGAGSAMKGAGKMVGEGVMGAGSAIKGAGLGLVDAKPGKKNYPKKNPRRAKEEKKFHKGFKAVPREEPKDTNIVGNITKLLPANTFLMFQTLAPLATNDGNCHKPEIFMTSIMLFILASTCMLVCFTDTIQFNGKVYHGLVTWGGLWNPSFKGDPAFIDLRQYEQKLAQFYADRKRYKGLKREAMKAGMEPPPRPVEPVRPIGPQVMGSTYSSGNSQYQLKATDFLHAALSAMAFCTLTMLTSPVSTCFYPDIPSTVVKTLPLLVGFIISAIFAFSPPARNGIAHPLSPKVPSVTDNYKPPDPKGVVHGPQLPPKPAAKGGAGGHGGDDDDDNDGSFAGSAKKMFGKLFGDSDGDQPNAHGGQPNALGDQHHGGSLNTVKSLAHGFFDKYGDELKDGAAYMAHSLGDGMKKEANLLLGKAGVQNASKEFHIPLAQMQSVAKSANAEALMAGLASMANAGNPALAAAAAHSASKSANVEALLAGLAGASAAGHPALAAAANSAYAQGAKDAMMKLHQDIQIATSGPPSSLSKQSSMAITRGNSMLDSAGPSLSLPSAHDAQSALFHEAAQVLQRSGLASAAPHGSEAASIALAAGHALMQAGLLPGGQSPQAHALNAYAQGINVSAANALVRDATSLGQQGGKSYAELQDELAKQQSAFTHGLNAQLQTLYNPAASVAQGFTGLIQNGSQTLNQVHDQIAQGTFAASLASAAAREAGTLLQEGADHGMTGVQEQLARQRAGVVERFDTQVQSITQPVSSLALQGSQAMSSVKADLMKQKDVLTQEVDTQTRALSTPATSVAHDFAALGTPTSQSLVEGVNSQFVESLARGMARGMSMKLHAVAPVQEHISSAFQAPVALDVASLIQAQGNGQMQHLPALDPVQMRTAQQVVESHLRRLASNPSVLLPTSLPTPPSVTMINTVVESRVPAVQQMAESSRRVRDTAGIVIEDVTDAARGIAAQASTVTSSQLRTASSEIVATATSAALANASARIWRDRPESTEITDAISVEEITSESETEGRSEQFRSRDPSSSQSQVSKKQT